MHAIEVGFDLLLESLLLPVTLDCRFAISSQLDVQKVVSVLLCIMVPIDWSDPLLWKLNMCDP